MYSYYLYVKLLTHQITYMRNHYIYYLLAILTISACTVSDENWQSENKVVTNTTSILSAQPAMWEIESMLTVTFIKDFGKQKDSTLSSIIQKLEIFTESKQAFVDLMPTAGYEIITVSELEEIRSDYDMLYVNLPISLTEKAYTDELLRMQDETAFYTFLDDIAADTNLSTDSKAFLTYLAHSVYDNGDKDDVPVDDSTWRKQKICAIANSWSQSKAQVVFNGILMNVLY